MIKRLELHDLKSISWLFNLTNSIILFLFSQIDWMINLDWSSRKKTIEQKSRFYVFKNVIFFPISDRLIENKQMKCQKNFFLFKKKLKSIFNDQLKVWGDGGG